MTARTGQNIDIESIYKHASTDFQQVPACRDTQASKVSKTVTTYRLFINNIEKKLALELFILKLKNVYMIYRSNIKINLST